MKRSNFKPRKESMQQSWARRQREKGFPAKKAVSTFPKPQKPAAGKPEPRKTALRKVSAKRSKENREYTSSRKAFLQEHWRCQVATAHCSIHATDVHHRAGRTGKNYLDASTWLSACRECHNWIHAHPNLARELGLLV